MLTTMLSSIGVAGIHLPSTDSTYMTNNKNRAEFGGGGGDYALLKSDVTRRDHVSVVMDAGSRIVNFTVHFIRDGTVFA